MNLEKAIAGCRKSDQLSQKYLFDRYSEAMLMLCMRYVKNLHDAEELMLTGFQRFYGSIGRFVYTNDAGVSAWLKKIMVNECLGMLRKGKGLHLGPTDAAAEVPANGNVFGDLAAADIFRLITQLPAGYRTVFNLFAVEGYSHKEIAVMLGCTEGTSKSQLNKARAILQQQIKNMQYL
jgi:RNA polymerase sigma-70 factor (ECF subfamily)